MAKLTPGDLEDAANDLASIPYFPKEARASVMRELAKMMPHLKALRWTIDAAVARCKVWPGMSELRGLLCTRFDAADGIDEPNCSIPGYTPEEQESRYLEKHERYKSQELSAGAREILQLAAGKRVM